jgi:hypothetical protein
MNGLINFPPIPTSACPWPLCVAANPAGKRGTLSPPFWKRYTPLSLLRSKNQQIQT